MCPSPRTLAAAVVAGLLVAPAPALAQWEGVIRTREISFDAGMLQSRIGDALDKVIDIPLAEILAAGQRSGEEWDFSSTDATLKIKGPRIRTDMMGAEMAEMGGGYGIVDTKQGIMWMVMPTQRMIMEMNFAEMEGMMAQMRQMQDDVEAVPTVEPLGRTRTINGVRCAGYRVQTDDMTVIAWVSDADPALHQMFKDFAALVKDMDQGDTDADILLAPHGFPMLTYKLYESGQIQIEETVAIEQQRVADSEFQLPDGFQKMSMMEMMQQQMEQMRRKN